MLCLCQDFSLGAASCLHFPKNFLFLRGARPVPTTRRSAARDSWVPSGIGPTTTGVQSFSTSQHLTWNTPFHPQAFPCVEFTHTDTNEPSNEINQIKQSFFQTSFPMIFKCIFQPASPLTTPHLAAPRRS